jgi:UDP-2-acetamido-3-amino-2,3-dideoxy-glucuronate N-acetyltransferase
MSVIEKVRRIHPSAQIHPLAHVGADVKIGHGTKVWQFASVIRGAIVGENCTIASATLIDGASIGHRCKIEHAAAVGPGVRLANDVFVGPQVIFCNDFWPRTHGEGFDMATLQSGKWCSVVRGGASIGAHAVILPGVIIGAGAMIAAGAVVDRSVPDGHLLRRDGQMMPIDPALPVKRMRFAGEPRQRRRLSRLVRGIWLASSAWMGMVVRSRRCGTFQPRRGA